jgi:polyphosphate glucokinase
MDVLGIDIGGTGIKGAPVDTTTGELVDERYRIPTPSPSTPKAVSSVVAEIARHFDWTGPVGCGFPGVVHSGVVRTAANVSKKWIGTPAAELFSSSTGCSSFTMVNDADAAGLAEMRLGAGRKRSGVVMVLTFGTGIGTALFVDGKLVPNAELGHLEVGGVEAERWASEKVRVEEDLSWKDWSRRVNTYLNRVHAYFWPELIVVGGGASKKFDKFRRHLDAPCEIVVAELRNRAGIIGAALAAVEG